MSGQVVLVKCRYLQDSYESEYLGDVCCGEMLRNCCVNLGIDPDMSNGYIHNVEVYLTSTESSDSASLRLWAYNPSRRIDTCCFTDSQGLLRLNVLLKMK